jgi:Na+-translocating ferredoxin:NAD+ oxidoreductase RnfD subunit
MIYLEWNADWLHYALSIGGCIFFQYIAECFFQRKIIPPSGFKKWGLSVLISALSICLLLKVNAWWVSLFAAALTVGGKYIFRIRGKHIFNPSALGIVLTLLITKQAWLSPGQWGSNAIVFFMVITLGTIVVTRVQKLDISLAFLLTYGGLLYWRQTIILGWPNDFFIHSITTGSLLLFTFFMISDPRTAPSHPVARIAWAIVIAIISFYLAAFKWKYNTMIWTLVLAAPLVPLMNYFFPGKEFTWKSSPLHFAFLHKIKTLVMKPVMKKIAALFMLCSMISYHAFAFCGFYVAKADGTLKNKTSQVIVVRDGEKTVITMYNDFKGSFKDFAMVVPVPVVLKEKDIKVVEPGIFTVLNEYSKPRLVEYFDQNPCSPTMYEDRAMSNSLSGKVPGLSVDSYKKRETVHIEARYLIGEYDILILSAQESSGLKDWLTENGYKIPEGAEEVLEPYIKSNLKFFVVKVNEKELKKLQNNFLRPIQISFNSPKFMLPIRLGMANADGDQDMIVYGFTKKGRIECTNYRTISLPTGKKIPLFVKNNFGNFYTNLFQHQWDKEGKSIAMLEYAWDVSPHNFMKCDPCVATAPGVQDLVQAGVWWIDRDWTDYNDVQQNEQYTDQVYFTRLHIRYNRRAFPQDLMFQVTPNTESYQARYVITHPATGDFNCDAGRKYLKELKERRADELDMLSYLTGKGYSDWDVVVNEPEEKYVPKDVSYNVVETTTANGRAAEKNRGLVVASLGLIGIVSLALMTKRKA